ncbi:MAG: helix-turn-helix transcriptional regulator [Bacteroidales bacterium]|nr:helix-turn-helix transcriptional regulator [Bacteroidales bacterium]
MENEIIISFILGLSVMYFWMTAFLFIQKGGKLSFIVATLMSLLGIQCFISLFFLHQGTYLTPHYWPVITGIDIIAVPMYAIILRELVRPGSVTLKAATVNVLPFTIVVTAYVITEITLINWVMIFGAGVYGLFYLIWTHININKYNRRLKEQYSYNENINLDWLHKILWIFFALLVLWIIDTLSIDVDMDCVYLIASIVMWMIIDYSLYRHEAVMDSLGHENTDMEDSYPEDIRLSDLGLRIERLFREEKIFLNPNLKISDIAGAVGSNRTYVSAYFNREASSSFYDYVNGLRIEYACRLLKETELSVKIIASESGYNSPQAFIRVFTKFKGCSPSKYKVRIDN